MFKKMIRYLKLYKVFSVQTLKSLMQSKVDFFVGLAGFLLTQTLGIAFLGLIFKQIPDLKGWDLKQLIFIYGFAQIPRGLDHLLTDNLWMLGWRIVIRGEFDRYILRPMNLFFQVICDRFQVDAFGELIVGIILVIYSLVNNVVYITPLRVIAFFISVIAGSVIYTSIKLFFASLAFWVKDSSPFLQTAYETADFAKYPTEIYAKPVKFIITWIIPFAFVAYIPASYFLIHKSLLSTIGIECIIAVVFWFISYALFKKGTTIYESAGN